MTLIGRFFRFACDFCGQRQERKGYGLPPGWKWLAANVVTGEPLRHICPACIGAGKHGDEALHESGQP